MAFPRRGRDKLGMSVHALQRPVTASVPVNVVGEGCVHIYLAVFISCVYSLYLQTIRKIESIPNGRKCNLDIEEKH